LLTGLDSNVTDSEAYLSDAHGRRVTPRVFAPPLAVEAEKHGSGNAPKRGRPPKLTPEEKARQSQAEATKKKREIGPGIDRGGARLANEKRRAGFVDDEDGEEVIVDDE
jgi:hypothetical protein